MKNLSKQVLATLKKVNEMESTLYLEAKALLEDPMCYHVGDNSLDTWDEETLLKAIPAAVLLVDLTGGRPFHHLQAIFDASDTDTGLLYPFCKLKAEPLTRIEQIYHLAHMLHTAVEPLEMESVVKSLESGV